MDTKLGGLILAALFVSQPGWAGALQDATTDEACTSYAADLLTGRQLGKATPAEILQEVASRGATCEPLDRYFEIAKYRLQAFQEQNDRKRRSWNDFYERQQQQRDEGFRMQMRQYQTPKPLQTNCQQLGAYTNCTTTGG